MGKACKKCRTGEIGRWRLIVSKSNLAIYDLLAQANIWDSSWRRQAQRLQNQALSELRAVQDGTKQVIFVLASVTVLKKYVLTTAGIAWPAN